MGNSFSLRFAQWQLIGLQSTLGLSNAMKNATVVLLCDDIKGMSIRISMPARLIVALPTSDIELSC
ncbi:MAG: hypothetical protein JKY51_06575 [Opitutaceae bacterium]|nr:hypothetical protein [Opitutaceae bacterium]